LITYITIDVGLQYFSSGASKTKTFIGFISQTLKEVSDWTEDFESLKLCHQARAKLILFLSSSSLYSVEKVKEVLDNDQQMKMLRMERVIVYGKVS
jgi:hypothetical protein